MRKELGAVCLLAVASVAQMSAGVIYTQNFEGVVGSEWTGSGGVASAGTMPGFGQLHWQNVSTGSTTLTLTGLAAHSTISLNFDLALWDSIDIGSDQFVIRLDGSDIYNSTDFGNYFPGDNISHGPGLHYTATFTDFAVPNYGSTPGYRDAGQHVSFATLAHNASTATFVFQFPNSQGGTDESFGLDNFVISTNARDPQPGQVPEPSTIMLSLAGLGALALLRRK